MAKQLFAIGAFTAGIGLGAQTQDINHPWALLFVPFLIATIVASVIDSHGNS